MGIVNTLKDCFEIDAHKFNQIPNNRLKRFYNLCFTQRYSMPVYLRLTEYFYKKYQKQHSKFYLFWAHYFKRKNEVVNQFEHGYEHNIAAGTLFHHTGVTLNDGVLIGSNVQIFKNVTFAKVKDQVCEIGDDSVIFSHVIILGRKIGRNCVIGAGSVVISDIPDNSIVVGNPAKVVKECVSAHEYLEYR